MPAAPPPDSNSELLAMSKSPTQIETQAKEPRRDAAQMRTHLCYHYILAYHQPYLSGHAERVLRITVVPLDLRSDSVSDGGPRFIEPASPNKLKAFLKANKTWDESILLPICEDDEAHLNNLKGRSGTGGTRYYEGYYMLYGLLEFARTPYGRFDLRDPEWFNPDWESAGTIGWSKMQNKDSMEMNLWSLQCLYDSTATDRPHTYAFVNHLIPLETDKLTTGEMTAATGIISLQRCFRGFNHHRYIPATIFSASFRDIRVVQVWHDREDPDSLHVRRSPIMSFLQGAKANQNDWMTLLCWFMGDQLENTMPHRDSKSGKSELSEVTKHELESNPDINNSGSNSSVSDAPDEVLNDHEDETGSAIQTTPTVERNTSRAMGWILSVRHKLLAYGRFLLGTGRTRTPTREGK